MFLIKNISDCGLFNLSYTTMGTFINYRRKTNMTLEQISKLANELCVRFNIPTNRSYLRKYDRTNGSNLILYR